MTYSAVQFDAALLDGRTASRKRPQQPVKFILRASVFGLGALAFVGTAAVAVTLTAAWMASGSIEPRARLPHGPGSIALLTPDQITKTVAQKPSGAQWAGAFIDRSKPMLPAETARPVVAQSYAVAVAVPAAAVPLPRAIPTKLAQIRTESEQAASQQALQAVQPMAQPVPQAMGKLETLMAPELPSVVVPAAKPQPAPRSESKPDAKLEMMAKLDPKVTEPPKPAPVASIPASVSVPGVLPDSVSRTAVYDITGSIVHMPDGSKLVAQSGLGAMMNDPRHTKVRMRGPTPPNVYVLTERERLFHGVRAIRMNPFYKEKMYGRDGILAHSYMLGPNGQSNGCVSFKDYEKFLTAFLEGKVDKMVVVDSLRGASWKTAAMQAESINASPRRYVGGYSPSVMPPSEITSGRSEPRYTASIGSLFGSALGFAPERGAGNQ